MTDGEQGGGFWRTLPGILSAVAAFVTALTGLVIGLNQVGVLGSGRPQTPSQPSETSSLRQTRSPPASADAVAGTWSGTVPHSGNGPFEVELSIAEDCEVKETCGSISVSHLPCFGDLSFKGVAGERYEFSVDHFSAASSKACDPGAGEYLTPQGDDALRYTTAYDRSIRGILHPPR